MIEHCCINHRTKPSTIPRQSLRGLPHDGDGNTARRCPVRIPHNDGFQGEFERHSNHHDPGGLDVPFARPRILGIPTLLPFMTLSLSAVNVTFIRLIRPHASAESRTVLMWRPFIGRSARASMDLRGASASERGPSSSMPATSCLSSLRAGLAAPGLTSCCCKDIVIPGKPAVPPVTNLT